MFPNALLHSCRFPKWSIKSAATGVPVGRMAGVWWLLGGHFPKTQVAWNRHERHLRAYHVTGKEGLSRSNKIVLPVNQVSQPNAVGYRNPVGKLLVNFGRR